MRDFCGIYPQNPVPQKFWKKIPHAGSRKYDFATSNFHFTISFHLIGEKGMKRKRRVG